MSSNDSTEDESAGSRAAVAGVMPAEDAAPLTGKAATQERILVSATELFLTRGYDNTTIAQVAEHAEVSRATVFWHFSDKESLFRECFNRLMEPFRVSLARDQSALPPEKRLRENVELYASMVQLHRDHIEGALRWAMEHPKFRDWLTHMLLDLHNRFGGVLTETIADIVPPGHDPHAIATGILLMMDGATFLTHFDSAPRSIDLRRASIEAVIELIPRRVPTRY